MGNILYEKKVKEGDLVLKEEEDGKLYVYLNADCISQGMVVHKSNYCDFLFKAMSEMFYEDYLIDKMMEEFGFE